MADVGVWLIVGAIAASGLLALAAELPARILHGAWLPTQQGGWVGAGLGVLANPADPARAWPSSSAGTAPGAALYWSTAALLASLIGAGAAVVRGWRPAGLGWLPMAADRGAARLARASDLRILHVRGPQLGRIGLGRFGRHLLAAEKYQSCLVFSPTSMGKTKSVAIPALLEWDVDCPAVALSVKPDLFLATWRRRRQGSGRVLVFDPTQTADLDVLGLERVRYSPLGEIASWGDAQREAEYIAAALASDATVREATFWSGSAAQVMAPLLLAAVRADRGMGDVLSWSRRFVERGVQREILAILTGAGDDEAAAVADALWQWEPRTRDNVFATAQTLLRAYGDPLVAESASHCDIDWTEFLQTGSTLYQIAPGHEQERLRSVFEGQLNALLRHAYSAAARAGGALERALLALIDEASIAAPHGLDTFAATAPSHHIVIVDCWHDLAQIEARYGVRARTVVNNHRARVLLGGGADAATLSWAVGLIGEQEERRESVTHGAEGQRSTTEASGYRPLLQGHELREQDPGRGVLIYGHLRPAHITLRQWDHDRRLRRLAAGAAEA